MSDPIVFDPPWSDHVKFNAAEGFAYVPNAAIVRDPAINETDLQALLAEGESLNFVDDASKEFRRVTGTFDTIRVVAHLRAKGVDAQPDHVLFAHGTCCCCGPHPAMWFDPSVNANPFHANPFHANPFHANPFHANPFHANPFHANPADPNGPTTSSARPADPPNWYTGNPSPAAAINPSIVVLDTGLAGEDHLPEFLRVAAAVTVPAVGANDIDVADVNNDQWLDPVAGHGTFIAGIIERIAPGCSIEVIRVIRPQGEGNESSVVDQINNIANREVNRPAFLNLSFGGYVWERAPMLTSAVLHAQRRGIVVVASAGNDGSCRPSFPAAIPGVVSVGAIGPDGPAYFSNYGDWVRACAPGMDVVSSFFKEFNGNEPPRDGRDIDSFQSWATWSGTSFAAPAVVGALVREMRVSNCLATEAVTHIIDAPWLGRIPGLGAVVNV